MKMPHWFIVRGIINTYALKDIDKRVYKYETSTQAPAVKWVDFGLR